MTNPEQPQPRIDLNCDLGEGFGAYAFGLDDALIGAISSANIACGFHAGDPHIMRRTVDRCLAAGVAVGAHPGLPDRLGFGRRFLDCTPEEVYDFVVYQIGALAAFVRAAGGALRHVKPHGALYHMANRDEATAAAIARAARDAGSGLVLYAQSGSLLLAAAEQAGLPAAAEAFADRGYGRDGQLLPRSGSGALLSGDAAVRQALSLALRGEVSLSEGAPLRVPADTICLHGDGNGAGELAAAIRRALEASGVEIGPPPPLFLTKG